MIKQAKTLCRVQSDNEREVYAGSGFCRRCKFFNGMIERKVMSCLNPRA